MGRTIVVVVVLFFLATLAIVWLARQPLQQALFDLTGEEAILPQISGTVQYALTRLQPPLQTADDTPVRYADVNPYGVNTFLQNEVEPEKREKAIQMIAEAGFQWIRQEFPWQDIEIHGKGDFEDRRHEPYQSAWNKYDQIVDLAEKYDLKIMARLSTPPAWSRALTDTVGTFAPPDNLNDYGDFVEAVAARYRGRIPAYQIWNEPNIYPEWGVYPINAEEYTALLKEGYTRVKAAAPDAIVVMGALAATIELDRVRRYDAGGQPTSPGGLSDVLFLQQLYAAGAAPYFDVLAMQGYGLWSGPTDRRMQPRVLNFSRPLYVRDVMVRNGDAHKPIWLSELGWNAVPPESGIPPVYGQVTPEQQGRYTALAYERLEREWPWLGVGFYWFFKQADDRERAGNPQYYFRMVEPDFTPLPVYQAMKEKTHQPPVMYRGWHQASHWIITYEGDWQTVKQPEANFGEAICSDQVGATATFTFEGSSLDLAVVPSEGRLRVQIDQEEPVEVDLMVNSQLSVVNSQSKIVNRKSKIVNLAHALPQRAHQVRLEVIKGPVRLDGFVVENRPDLALNRAGSALMVLATLGGLWLWWKQRTTKAEA
ncbi:MAG: cellulase family glycosylhydrolase [Chloroflexi bacterium]|nr:cellulase family glycosylhydrolase [Chloroflexota bacterium]